MRVARIILLVTDLDTSIEFWTSRVGLRLSSQAGPFAFIDGNGAELVLHQFPDRPEDDSATEIVLEVDDIESSHAEMLARGVPFEVEPRAVTSDGDREFWAAHFYDPDHHLASITGWV